MDKALTEQEASEHNKKISSPVAVVPLVVVNRWIAEGGCTSQMIAHIYISFSSSADHHGYCLVSL
jgi:hypothetical protein